MALHPLAGKASPPQSWIDPEPLVAAYYSDLPDPEIAAQRVSFGTSGHRGSPLKRAFNELHIWAVTQAVCDYRQQAGTTGPLYLGKDTHAASGPAQQSALQVLVGNGVETFLQEGDG